MDVQNDPFYPTRWTEENKQAIRDSILWPLLVGAHYSFNNKLYISYTNNNEQHRVISMGLLNGVQIILFTVESKNGDFIVKEFTDGVRVITGDKKPLISSKTTQYILKKFNDSIEPCCEQIRRRIIDGESRVLQNILLEGANRLRDNRPARPSIVLTEEQSAFVLESMYGVVSVDVNNKNITSELQEVYSKHVTYIGKIQKYEKQIREFFDKDKWIIIGANNNCKIIGYMNTSILADAVLVGAMKTVFVLDSSTMPIPFNLYNSHEHTPFREEIMAALTMCKVAREGKNKPIIQCSDPEGLFPVNTTYNLQTGMLVWLYNNQSKCYMFDKLV